MHHTLSFYYTQNYRDALEETDKAISIFPNLAIAYARKGSIYYRLGDQDRATVNWNIALKLDPEYCLLYTSPSPRDGLLSRMPSSA